MNLELNRIFGGEDSTLGILSIDGKPFGFTCEDEYRLEKVHGETRIPPGLYYIKYRDEGGMVKRYRERYAWHKGMLHLHGVHDFKYIYIHPGNTEADTDGCILVGNGATLSGAGGGHIHKSVDAYTALYKRVSKALDSGEIVTIHVIDEG